MVMCVCVCCVCECVWYENGANCLLCFWFGCKPFSLKDRNQQGHRLDRMSRRLAAMRVWNDKKRITRVFKENGSHLVLQLTTKSIFRAYLFFNVPSQFYWLNLIRQLHHQKTVYNANAINWLGKWKFAVPNTGCEFLNCRPNEKNHQILNRLGFGSPFNSK